MNFSQTNAATVGRVIFSAYKGGGHTGQALRVEVERG